MTSTHRVCVHDRRFAGGHPAVVIGPVRIPGGAAGVRQRVAEFARSGPRNRLGMVPRRDSARWRFDPERVSIHERGSQGPLDVAGETARIGRNPAVPLSIEISGGDHLLATYDHGLGDGVFIVELIAALTRRDPRFPLDDDSTSTTVRTPVRTALAHQVRTHPLDVAKGTARVLRPRSTTDHPPSFTPLGAGSTRVVYAASPPGFLEHLRRHRDAQHPGASSIAVFSHLVAQRLRHAGLSVSDSVTFMVNMRRYLPDHRSTLGNFIGAVEADTRSPTDATDQLRAAIGQPDLLIRQAIGDGITRMLPRRLTEAHQFRCVETEVVSLVVSDLTNHQAADTIEWTAGDGPRVFAIAGVTRASNCVTLILTRVDQQLHVTASVTDRFLDIAAVRAGLVAVLTTPLAVA